MGISSMTASGKTVLITRSKKISKNAKGVVEMIAHFVTASFFIPHRQRDVYYLYLIYISNSLVQKGRTGEGLV